jgi:hypothetical protein
MLLQTKTRPLESFRRPGKVGSVQRKYVGARQARQEVLCLQSSTEPGGRDYRAIVEVQGINFQLKDEAEQELITDIFQNTLAGLSHRLQVLMRVLPLDLAPYFQSLMPPPARVLSALVERSENGSDPPLDPETVLGVWREHAASLLYMLRQLAANRTLLERHFYLVIPADLDSARGRVTLGLGRRKRKKRLAAEFERARQQLALRTSEVTRQFADMGLVCRRLPDKELIQLAYSCLTPHKALRYPLPDAVLDGIDRVTLPASWALGEEATTGTLRAQTGGAPSVQAPPDKEEATRRAWSWGWGKWRKKKRQPEPIWNPMGDFTQLADVIAPGSCVLQPDALIVEQEYNRVIVVDALPRLAPFGFIGPLTEVEEPIEVSIFYNPNAPGPATHQLNLKRAGLRSTRNVQQGRDNYQHPELQVSEADVEDLIPKVASREEKMLDVSIYILLRGASVEELDERTEDLMGLLAGMQVVARSAIFEQDLAWRSCQPECRNLLGRTHWLPASSAAILTFLFISNTLMMSDGIVEGMTRAGEPVVLNWWHPSQRNANRLLVAPSGSGKSYDMKIVLYRLYLKYMRGWDGRGDPPAQFFVIDPDGEWERACAGLRGQYIKMGPGSSHHINPFVLPVRRARSVARSGYAQGEDQRTDVLAEAVQQAHALLEIMLADRSAAGAGTLTASEKGLLDRCLYQMYRNAGISSDPSTHGLAPPTMKDLYEVLESGQCGPDPTGLASRLRRYVEGSLAGLFSGATNVRLNSPVVVFNVPDDVELRAIIYFLISRYVWTVSFGSSIPRVLIVDEMLSLLEHPEGAHFLETMFQRSRKHYLSLVGIVQDPARLKETTIPANCATIMLMKQEAASLDLVGNMFHLSEPARRALELCGKGDALLMNNQNRILVHVVASEREHRMASTDPVELARWEEEERQAREHSAGGRVRTLHVARTPAAQRNGDGSAGGVAGGGGV